MTKSTEQILERIRELVPELKELKFGCVYKYKEDNGNWKEYTVVYRNDIEKKYGVGKNEVWSVPDYDKGYQADWRFEIKEYFEIIGLPVHLENLLSAINLSKNGNRLDDIGLSFNFQKNVLYFENKEYWLDKTVEQNLQENEALRSLISELIF